MDKKRDDMVSLDEFKEFFNKLSTCDFASLTEFLFQIFDTNGNTKFKLVEVSCFSNQNSAHNNLNFCIILKCSPLSTVQQWDQDFGQKSS